MADIKNAPRELSDDEFNKLPDAKKVTPPTATPANAPRELSDDEFNKLPDATEPLPDGKPSVPTESMAADQPIQPVPAATAGLSSARTIAPQQPVIPPPQQAEQPLPAGTSLKGASDMADFMRNATTPDQLKTLAYPHASAQVPDTIAPALPSIAPTPGLSAAQTTQMVQQGQSGINPSLNRPVSALQAIGEQPVSVPQGSVLRPDIKAGQMTQTPVEHAPPAGQVIKELGKTVLYGAVTGSVGMVVDALRAVIPSLDLPEAIRIAQNAINMIPQTGTKATETETAVDQFGKKITGAVERFAEPIKPNQEILEKAGLGYAGRAGESFGTMTPLMLAGALGLPEPAILAIFGAGGYIHTKDAVVNQAKEKGEDTEIARQNAEPWAILAGIKDSLIMAGLYKVAGKVLGAGAKELDALTLTQRMTDYMKGFIANTSIFQAMEEGQRAINEKLGIPNQPRDIPQTLTTAALFSGSEAGINELRRRTPGTEPIHVDTSRDNLPLATESSTGGIEPTTEPTTEIPTAAPVAPLTDNQVAKLTKLAGKVSPEKLLEQSTHIADSIGASKEAVEEHLKSLIEPTDLSRETMQAPNAPDIIEKAKSDINGNVRFQHMQVTEPYLARKLGIGIEAARDTIKQLKDDNFLNQDGLLVEKPDTMSYPLSRRDVPAENPLERKKDESIVAPVTETEGQAPVSSGEKAATGSKKAIYADEYERAKSLVDNPHFFNFEWNETNVKRLLGVTEKEAVTVFNRLKADGILRADGKAIPVEKRVTPVVEESSVPSTSAEQPGANPFTPAVSTKEKQESKSTVPTLEPTEPLLDHIPDTGKKVSPAKADAPPAANTAPDGPTAARAEEPEKPPVVEKSLNKAREEQNKSITVTQSQDYEPQYEKSKDEVENNKTYLQDVVKTHLQKLLDAEGFLGSFDRAIEIGSKKGSTAFKMGDPPYPTLTIKLKNKGATYEIPLTIPSLIKFYQASKARIKQSPVLTKYVKPGMKQSNARIIGSELVEYYNAFRPRNNKITRTPDNLYSNGYCSDGYIIVKTGDAKGLKPATDEQVTVLNNYINTKTEPAQIVGEFTTRNNNDALAHIVGDKGELIIRAENADKILTQYPDATVEISMKPIDESPGVVQFKDKKGDVVGVVLPLKDELKDNAVTVHVFPVTERMKDDVLYKGQPLFSLAHHGTLHVLGPEKEFPHGRFRMEFIGTGEGAQVFGHGIYFAENQEVGKEYQKNLKDATAPPLRFFNGNELKPQTPEYHAATLLETTGKTLQGVKKEVSGWIQKARQGEDVGHYKAVLDFLNKAETKKQFTTKQHPGSLYKLDIPDDVIPKLLDWDKKLSQQTDIKDKIRKAFKDNKFDDSQIDSMFNRDITGEQAYVYLASAMGGKQQASEYLASIGIPGNKYLDQGSRGKGEGTYNFVIWNQKVLDRIALLERNGKKLDAIRQEEKAQDGKPEEDRGKINLNKYNAESLTPYKSFTQAQKARPEIQKKLQEMFGNYATLDRIENDPNATDAELKQPETANAYMPKIEYAATNNDKGEVAGLLKAARKHYAEPLGVEERQDEEKKTAAKQETEARDRYISAQDVPDKYRTQRQSNLDETYRNALRQAKADKAQPHDFSNIDEHVKNLDYRSTDEAKKDFEKNRIKEMEETPDEYFKRVECDKAGRPIQSKKRSFEE